MFNKRSSVSTIGGTFALALIFFINSQVFPQNKTDDSSNLKLWYNQPASSWLEALPVGNGRLGAMVYGSVPEEHIQFNQETLWRGQPHDYARKGASKYLQQIRNLLEEGKQREAEKLAMEHFMSDPLKQMEYQPFGDIFITFPGHDKYTNYRRELDLNRALVLTTYQIGNNTYTREVIASNPHQVIAVRLNSEQSGQLNFQLRMGSAHEDKSIKIKEDGLSLEVAVKDGALWGLAHVKVKTDGEIKTSKGDLEVANATTATLLLTASTNFVNYRDVSGDPQAKERKTSEKLGELSFDEIYKYHLKDYQTLFNRFAISFGNHHLNGLATDQRLVRFKKTPEDPQLIALYVQYGRYLLISSSRKGTQPANLQGIWNQDLKPAWGSKYTTNINLEMNYWIANMSNLPECNEPLFQLIRECSETGAVVAKEHYGVDGWILHHNTDIWRGTAPINHANHGIWLGGSGWLAHHLWEHFLFTKDEDFLREKAYPLMKGAAKFYSGFLVEDPETGWLVSTPSNSPETGGLVKGPTMDHQIIRSLFNSCIQAVEILETDSVFARQLKNKVTKIVPNQIGRYGQLQEWMVDIDDPNNHHRHVSHLWGMHPGNDFNWESNSNLMEAAKKSLLLRGDEGTGWSLAWKINFWARLLDGNHAYELIKLLFRPVEGSVTGVASGGGSYPNLFDAHPPFQIDGNFGAPSGIIELLVQSHMTHIDLLPALPDTLPEGKISGVCARGGFELSFSWEDGELQELQVISKAGKTCRLRYQGKSVVFETIPDRVYKLDGDLGFK